MQELLLAAALCLAVVRSHPLEAVVSSISVTNSAAPVLPSDNPLMSAVSSMVSSASLSPHATPLAYVPITEWIALGDSCTTAIGSNSIDDYIRNSFDFDRFQQSYVAKMIFADARLP